LGAAILGFQASAQAQTNLVTNGTFQVTGGTTSFQFGTWGPYTPAETLAGWQSVGYNFAYIAGQTSATGFYGSFSLWNQSNASNGLNNAAPGNTNYLALDSDYPASDGQHNATAAVTQTISGLVVGQTYNVSFAWAGAQQQGFDGATTDNLTVSLGGSSQTTNTINVANHGFSGWITQTFGFIATSSSEVLSFLAGGSPAVPPFVLLANVSVTQAPEPASVAVLLTGLLGVIGLGATRRRPRLGHVKA
jgi:hypothetical protein